MTNDLRRLIWTSCSMNGEGVRARGVGQGIDLRSPGDGETFVISANGVDYEVVVTQYNTGYGWEVEDVGSFEGRYRVDPADFPAQSV